MHMQELVTYFTTMFAITNPIGNTGIFISMTSSQSVKSQRKTAFQVVTASMIILAIVTFFGDDLLNLFGIKVYALHLAGGLIILVMGMHMLQSKEDSVHTSHKDIVAAKSSDNIAVVPMSLPLIAGPGAMTAVIVYASKHPGFESAVGITLANLVLMVIVFVMLFFASYIKNLLGDSGIRVVGKVMGMILVAMAFMMLGDGITGYLQTLTLVS